MTRLLPTAIDGGVNVGASDLYLLQIVSNSRKQHSIVGEKPLLAYGLHNATTFLVGGHNAAVDVLMASDLLALTRFWNAAESLDGLCVEAHMRTDVPIPV